MNGPAFYASGAAAVIPGTTSTAQVALPGEAASGQQIRVLNEGSTTVFIAFGPTSSVTAVVDTGIFVGAGLCEVFTIPGDTKNVAAIYGSGSGNIRVQRGVGL